MRFSRLGASAGDAVPARRLVRRAAASRCSERLRRPMEVPWARPLAMVPHWAPATQRDVLAQVGPAGSSACRETIVVFPDAPPNRPPKYVWNARAASRSPNSRYWAAPG